MIALVTYSQIDNFCGPFSMLIYSLSGEKNRPLFRIIHESIRKDWWVSIRSRIFAICCDYEDCDHLDMLRFNPTHKALTELTSANRVILFGKGGQDEK